MNVPQWHLQRLLNYEIPEFISQYVKKTRWIEDLFSHSNKLISVRTLNTLLNNITSELMTAKLTQSTTKGLNHIILIFLTSFL